MVKDNRKRRPWACVGVGLLLLPALAASATPPREPLLSQQAAIPSPQVQGTASFSVEVEDGKLSANIQDAPLRQVLEALAQQIPLKVYLRASVGERKVSAVFSKEALEDGVKRILKDTSYVLSYSDPSPPLKGRTMEIRLATSDTGTLGEEQVREIVSPMIAGQERGQQPGDPAREKLLRELIDKALHAPDSKERLAALRKLRAEFKLEESISTFSAALKDKDHKVRRFALSSLEQGGNDSYRASRRDGPK